MGHLLRQFKEQSVATMNALTQHETNVFLGDVQTLLTDIATSWDRAAGSYLRELVEHRGRGFRPLLLLEAAATRSNTTARGTIVRLAASVELLHVASLIHDDYVDGADFRRQIPTPRFSIGAEATLLMGTWAAAQATRLANDVGIGFGRVLVDGATELADGQLADVQRTFTRAMQTEEYLHICSLKTGSLMKISLLFGAAAAQPLSHPETIKLSAIARDLGIAFQIVDDICDSLGRNRGKPSGLDAQNGLALHDLVAGGTQATTMDDLRQAAREHLDRATAGWREFFTSTPAVRGPFGQLNERLGEWTCLT